MKYLLFSAFTLAMLVTAVKVASMNTDVQSFMSSPAQRDTVNRVECLYGSSKGTRECSVWTAQTN